LADPVDVPVAVPPKDAEFEERPQEQADAALQEEYDSSEVDERPRLLGRARPRYPASAQRRDIEGFVRLQFVVDVDGRVGNIEVVASRPRRVFDEAAIEAVRRWTFTPGKVRGQAVATRCSITLRFELEG